MIAKRIHEFKLQHLVIVIHLIPTKYWSWNEWCWSCCIPLASRKSDEVKESERSRLTKLDGRNLQMCGGRENRDRKTAVYSEFCSPMIEFCVENIRHYCQQTWTSRLAMFHLMRTLLYFYLILKRVYFIVVCCSNFESTYTLYLIIRAHESLLGFLQSIFPIYAKRLLFRNEW